MNLAQITKPVRSHITSIILLLFILSLGLFSTQSSDLFMYLSLARHYFETGSLPQNDIFIYTNPGTPLAVHHQWLTYFIYYGLWAVGGYGSIIFFKALVIAATFGLVLWLRRTTAWTTGRLAVFLLAVHAASFRFIERGSIFSDFLVLLLCVILSQAKQVTWRLVMGLTLYFAFWVQLHAGFLVGFGILATWYLYHVLQKRTFRSWVSLKILIAPLGVLLNPKGFDGALYPIHFAREVAPTLSRYIFEWMPTYHPAYLKAPEFISFWLLAAIGVWSFLKFQGWKSVYGWWLIFALPFGVTSARFVSWVSLLMLLGILSMLPVRKSRDRILMPLTLVLALATAVMQVTGYPSSSGHRRPFLELDPKYFPSATLDFLKLRPLPGRLYAPQYLGDYLVWQRRTPVFAHGFLTSPQLIEESVLLTRSFADFERLAPKYNWSMLLVDKLGTYPDIYRILRNQNAWQIVTEDSASYLIYKLSE